MADFGVHSGIGGGVIGVPLRALGAPRWAVNVGTIYGAILGGLPDTLDWLLAVLGLMPRWTMYVILHATPPWWLYYQPSFFLHLWFDKFFHDPLRPGWNWWSEMYWLDLLMWAAAIIMMWYIYQEAIRAFWAWLKSLFLRSP